MALERGVPEPAMTRRPSEPIEPFDPFVVLGLAPGATRADVRRAYRARALAIHPDVAGTDATAADATADMTRLNRARDELLSRLPTRGRAGASTGNAAVDPDPSVHPKPRAPRPRPSGAEGHESAWSDHWSAWNELPRREDR